MSNTSPLSTIGLLGGMSWESSAVYYQQINQHVRAALGGLHSAPMILDSVDFAQMAVWQQAEEWDKAAAHLSQRAQALETAGATCIAIATNTMHKVYDDIARSVNVPVLHIAQPTIAALEQAGIQRTAFLGTRYSMEQDFIRRVFEQSGITLLMPDTADKALVHDIIFNELCQGTVNPSSRAQLQRIITDLAAQGAQGVVLGCTEIGLLLGENDVKLPMFDTTPLHTKALADVVLNGAHHAH